LGIFLAALTFVVVLFISGNRTGPTGNGPQASLPPSEVDTLLAAQDIPLGTVVTAEMFSVQKIAVGSRDAGVLGDPSQAIGRTTAVSILQGAQVHASDFQNRAIQLGVPTGKRAMAIAVNELSGVASLVTAGDSVDVIITLTGAQFPVTQILANGTIQAVPGINPLTTKMILQDIQILGTLSAQQPASTNANAAPPPPGYVGDFPAGSKLVILAVTPAQAEALAFARSVNEPNQNGGPDAPFSQIDLVLRAPADAGLTAVTTGVILKTLVDTYGVLPPQLVPVPVPTPR
jgi:Flp pilus assembly protein CpaB